MIKNFTIIVCIFFSIIYPHHCIAQDSLGKVADLEKNQPAPFKGILMTEDVATKLYLNTKFSRKECNLDIERHTAIEKLICKKDISLLDSKLQIEIERFNRIIIAKDDRIKFLEKRWTPLPWYKSSELWFSTGVVGGILITVAAGYALSNISR